MFYGLVNISFFFVLLPYVSPFPLPSDIQPFAGLFSAIIVLILFYYDKIRFDTFDLSLLFFAVFYLINFNYYSSPDNLGIVFRKHINILYAVPIYLTSKNCYNLYDKKVLFLVIKILSISALLQIFFGEFFYDHFGIYFNQRVAELGVRGVTGLMPEPTDFGFTLCYILLILVLFYSTDKIDLSELRLYAFVVIVLLLLTFAGAAYITAFFFLLMYLYGIYKKKKYFTLVLVLIVVYFLWYVFYEFGIRGYALLIMFISDPMQLIATTSFSYRFVHNIVAVYVFVDSYGAWHGVGAFKDVAFDVYDKYRVFDYLTISDYYRYAVEKSLYNEHIKSSFAQILVESGVVGVAFFVYLYKKIYRYGGEYRKFIFLLISFTLLQSFPLAYPYLWLLVGIVNSENLLSDKCKYRVQNNDT